MLTPPFIPLTHVCLPALLTHACATMQTLMMKEDACTLIEAVKGSEQLMSRLRSLALQDPSAATTSSGGGASTSAASASAGHASTDRLYVSPEQYPEARDMYDDMVGAALCLSCKLWDCIYAACGALLVENTRSS